MSEKGITPIDLQAILDKKIPKMTKRLSLDIEDDEEDQHILSPKKSNLKVRSVQSIELANQ